MINEIESLEIIKGKEILDIETEISMIAPIDISNKDEIMIEIPLKIIFDKYTLFIYNKWSIIGGTLKCIEDLKRRKISDIKANSQILELRFNSLDYIKVDLSNDGYIGPESIVLHGPNDLIIVWN